jgi:ABC-type uncharacterized transport system permease subunit
VSERDKGEMIEVPVLGGLVLSGVRPLIAVVLAFVVGAGFILAAGNDPIAAYVALLEGAVGSVTGLANTGVRATPLLIGGLGIAIAFKAGLFNLGAEGYMYAGGAAATVVGLIPLPVPPWMHVLLAVVAGAASGALWGLLPAYLRAYRSINEMVTTLMMNYVAIYLVSYLVQYGPLADPGATFPMSPLLLPSSHLPILIKGTSLHAGIILAFVLAIVLFFVVQYTPFGFKTRLVGANPEAARYAGINVARQILLVLLVSSALGGVAGAGEVLGLKLRLYDFFVSGVGYDGVAVALMANLNPLGIIPSAFFFGALKAGANKMQIVSGMETPMASVIQALTVLFVVAIGFAERVRLTRRKRKEQPLKEITSA